VPNWFDCSGRLLHLIGFRFFRSKAPVTPPRLRTIALSDLKKYIPKGTPKVALDKLVASLQEAVKDPGVNQRFADLGATAYPADKATPAALQAHLKAEIDRWAPLIKKAGVYAD